MKRFLLFAATAVVLGASAQTYPERTLNQNVPNGGFQHPGLLHTQQDFERMRRQLAAGDEQVTAAYNVLVNAEYSQATVKDPTPCETIVRGGGQGENYMSAARAATMAYQNALRWKLDGEAAVANADKAVEILNKWAATTTGISGDSNFALAAGLYGYEFANAAELMRDYPGWKQEDFDAFRRWMLNVWYQSSLDFLIRRNDTWSNTRYASNGIRPGHYWSNWGLCNVLTLMSIGILCDDVLIYNQGVSFFKYDHTGTSDAADSEYLTNHGLNEYLGNLVPRLTADAKAPLGQWGQMQESGRDQGHSLLACGLAADVCQTAWNQGDDLFGYLDNRLAKGIEYVAAYNFGNVEADDLPYYPYHYATCATAWHNATVQDVISETGRGGIRPIWGRIVAHYQAVKGIKMPYSVMALDAGGIDIGGKGSVSGGYDHMGYTILTCTPEKMDIHAVAAQEAVPTPLKAEISADGTIINGAEYGGIKQTANVPDKEAAPNANITLRPSVADGSTDTGQWEWNTGEKTRLLMLTPHRSGVYRVTYTNANGVQSSQLFTIAVENDGTTPTPTSVLQLPADNEDMHTASITYYSADGIPHSAPFPGLNICVRRFTNGTTSVAKHIF